MIKLLLLAVCLQAVLSVVECCKDNKPSYTRPPVTDQGSYITVCRQTPIEFNIVLDASRSISIPDFQRAKSFIEEFLSQFDVGSGKEGVRVSIISFGEKVHPEAGFNLTTYNTKEEVLAAVCRIPHSAGGHTRTDLGISHMSQVQLASDVVRPGVERISVVITDGDSTFKDKTKAAAEQARQTGIELFAVGVGSNVKRSELLNIAGDESRVLSVSNYSELNSIKNVLASNVCKNISKPTPPPPPKTICGELNPADVYFTFSSADLGLAATSKATSFISKVISHEEVKKGFRFGVISGSCPDDEGFNLKAYSTVRQYQTRLQQYDTNPLPRLSERLLGDAYSEENGGRVGISRVAVIITSGTEFETDELALQVQQLRQNGVKVYILDPSGQGVTVDGAQTLIGGSSTLQAESLISQLCPSFE